MCLADTDRMERIIVRLDAWRERLKSGSLSGPYAVVRNAKRRLLRQPQGGYVPLTFGPMPVDQLLCDASCLSDHSRFHYSLGYAYLERGEADDDQRAAASFRTAEGLGFESPERVAVCLARIAWRSGDAGEAARLLSAIEPDELTAGERAMVEEMAAPGLESASGSSSRRLRPETALPALQAMPAPAVSAIVPNYNYGRFLKERLRSVLGQTCGDMELLYVDDGSSDCSNAIARPFAADPRVRLRLYERNSGTVYRRWNEAAESAHGEWLWFANADDSAHPRFLERLLRLVGDRPDVVIAHSDVAVVDEVGRLIATRMPAAPEVVSHLERDEIRTGTHELVFLTRGLFLHTASAVLLRRRAFLEAGGFDVRLWGVADYDLYMRLLHRGDIAYAAEPLTYYRLHGSNTTSTTGSARHNLALAYAFAAAHLRMREDRRYSPEMRDAVLRRTRAKVFDLFADRSATVPDSWRFAADTVYQVVPDRRLR